MNVEKFTEKELKILQSGCPALNRTNIGQKVNDIIDQGGSASDVDLELTVDEVITPGQGKQQTFDIGGKKIAKILCQVEVPAGQTAVTTWTIDNYDMGDLPMGSQYIQTFNRGYEQQRADRQNVTINDETYNLVANIINNIVLTDQFNQAVSVNEIVISTNNANLTGNFKVYTIRESR